MKDKCFFKFQYFPLRIFLITVYLSLGVLLAAHNMVVSLPPSSPNASSTVRFVVEAKSLPQQPFFLSEYEWGGEPEQVYIRKGREEGERRWSGFPRNKISRRSWKIGLQNVTLQIQSKLAFPVILTQHLCVTFQAMATLHLISIHLQRGVGSKGLPAWEVFLGRCWCLWV